MKRLSIYVTLSTLITVLIFFLGCAFKLFEKNSWYDEFVHFLAGAWVAILIIWFSRRKIPHFLKKAFQNHFSLTIVILTIAVGLIWEAFEFILSQYLLNAYQYRPNLQPSNLDTLSDLLMDFAGAVLVVWFREK